MRLESRVEQLKGVGSVLAKRLERLDIATVGDLLTHYPRRYEDFSKVVTIAQMQPGPVTIRARIEQVAGRWARSRRLHITEAVLSDGTGTIKAVWFNQAFLGRQLHRDQEVIVAGRLEFKGNDLALQSPTVEPATGEGAVGRIVPIYPETEGIGSRQLERLVELALPLADELPDRLPEPVRRQHDLPDMAWTVRQLHRPTSLTELARAIRRQAFEELFFLMVTGLVLKQEIETETARPIAFKAELAQEFVAGLGFELTDAQRAAAWQILQDMEATRPMNRLLEGDVGSGKTVVAALAMLMALGGGYQAAVMVPTEILARQHHERLAPLFEAFDFRTNLLVASLPATEKRQVIEAVATETPQVVIGTQALLGGQLEFGHLGLAVVDEQHRFGVGQRLALKQKAGYLPHLLSLTATPIPRTLALTVYGDLDISIINTLPPGRLPVVTKLVDEAGRTKLYQEIDREIAAGQQVYVVCPLISESDILGLKSVEAEIDRLRRGPFQHRRLEGLHGRLTGADKTKIMADFRAARFDILVATSLIEVGVDVPAASVMIIEAADRFGLATLHQLRGRVGRSTHQSYCYLLSENQAPAARQRLRALERTADGFRLAQIDLELRGAGQIYGLKQHGQLDLRFADLGDTKLVAEARQAANTFAKDPAVVLQYPEVVKQINQLKAVTSLD